MSLKYALLGFLAESPKYGYEIKQKFEGALGNVWSVSYGQLYPTLRRLSELEWVTKKTAPGKKAAEKNIYSLTPKGRKKLDEWLVRPLRSNYKVKDEFTLKFLFFNKLPRETVLEYLRNQQRRTIEQTGQLPARAGLHPGGAGFLPAGHHPQGDRAPGGGEPAGWKRSWASCRPGLEAGPLPAYCYCSSYCYWYFFSSSRVARAFCLTVRMYGPCAMRTRAR